MSNRVKIKEYGIPLFVFYSKILFCLRCYSAFYEGIE